MTAPTNAKRTMPALVKRLLIWGAVAIILLPVAGAAAWWNRHAIVSAIAWPVSTAFHFVYYHNNDSTWENTYWLGTPTYKLPLDLWIMQEIIYSTKPDLIIEAGTLKGGSALFFASMFDLLNHGDVVSIDIEDFDPPAHPRITYLLGSSTDPAIVNKVKSLAASKQRVMVVLDSDHSAPHVLAELRNYGPMVTKGAYMIVEDTNVNGHPVYPHHGPGPMEALQEFMKENGDFEIDRSREKFLISFNPRGYLKKVQ